MSITTGSTVQLGRYQVGALLGQGGMGEVYRAHDSVLDHDCALKELRPDPSTRASMLDTLRAQFRREALALAQLAHPGLPRVSDYFEEDGNAYLVMDLVEGRSLQEAIAQRMDEAQAIAITCQVLDILDYIHRQSLLHRDVKPANILLTSEGRAILVDFGLVRLWDPADTRTVMLMRGIGTPRYAPPEQYSASYGQPGAYSDLYSLGATLYSLLSGQVPASATQRLLSPQNLPPLHEVAPGVSPDLEAVVSKAMAIQPSERYQTAAEMRQALQAVAVERSASASTALTAPNTPEAAASEPAPAPTEWPWPASDEEVPPPASRPAAAVLRLPPLPELDRQTILKNPYHAMFAAGLIVLAAGGLVTGLVTLLPRVEAETFVGLSLLCPVPFLVLGAVLLMLGWSGARTQNQSSGEWPKLLAWLGGVVLIGAGATIALASLPALSLAVLLMGTGGYAIWKARGGEKR